MRHGYRFNYRRPRSADSFAVTAVPAVAHLRGMPRLSIDKSQAIKGYPECLLAAEANFPTGTALSLDLTPVLTRPIADMAIFQNFMVGN